MMKALLALGAIAVTKSAVPAGARYVTADGYTYVVDPHTYAVTQVIAPALVTGANLSLTIDRVDTANKEAARKWESEPLRFCRRSPSCDSPVMRAAWLPSR